MAILRKSTDHDPRKGCSVQLGTLSYYRAHPGAQIGDPQESTQRIKAIFRDYSVSVDFVNALAPGSFAIGHSSNWVRPHHTMSGGIYVESDVYILSRSWSFVYPGSDAFVFCMSLLEDEDTYVVPNYAGHWDIRKSDAGKLSDKILNAAQNLSANQKAALMPPGSNITEATYRSAEFHIKHDIVTYEEPNVDFGQMWKPLETPFLRRLTWPEFSKSPKYRTQKEYRFALYLIGESKHVPGLKNRVLDLRQDPPLRLKLDLTDIIVS